MAVTFEQPTGSVVGEEAFDDIEVRDHAYQQMDLGHREILPFRALLIGLIYLCLSLVNYLGFEAEVGLLLAAMAAGVGVVFCLLSILYRQFVLPLSVVNGATFAELAFLQADGMAFLYLTQDIMNSYGVFVMIVGAGIFLTRFSWWIATIVMLLASWLITLSVSGIPFDLFRESLMIVASLSGSLLFMVLRRRTALRVSRVELEKNAYLAQLEGALEKIETLSGLLPICASCKNIRDESGQWQQIEVYVSDHSRANFSHGICPDCKDAMYSDT